MNHSGLTNWLHAPLWVRLLSVSVLALLSLWPIWLFGLQPVRQAAQQLERQQQERQQRVEDRLNALLALPALSVLQQQAAQLEERLASENDRRFTLPQLLAASGGTLRHWQPTEAGSELALMLNWPQFTRLMDYLAALRPAMTIPRLRLHGTDTQLELELEVEDAN